MNNEQATLYSLIHYSNTMSELITALNETEPEPARLPPSDESEIERLHNEIASIPRDGVENLRKLSKLYLQLQTELFSKIPIYMRDMMVMRGLPYDKQLEEIEEQIAALECPLFNQPMEMKKEEEVNGYKLGSCRQLAFTYGCFLQIAKLWHNQEENAKYDTFEMFCNEVRFCSDWNKMDKYGECFGGYWKYPEGSPERENAWELSYTENIKCVYDLPYPKAVIARSIQDGCNSRSESVPMSNYYCEWVKRKMAQINYKPA
jgi:hypothetical protein